MEALRSPISKVKAEDGTAVHHMLPHFSIEHPSDEDLLRSANLKPDPDIAYPDEDMESLQALVKSEGEEPEDNGHIAFVKRHYHPPLGRGHGPEGNGHLAPVGIDDGPEDDGNELYAKRQQAFPAGSWYEPQARHHQLIKADPEQDQVVDLDTIHDDADDDNDEPIIVKVESAGERERQRAARAEQELGRLQKEQLQAKFDHAVHRKDQVTIDRYLAPRPVLHKMLFPESWAAKLFFTQSMHTLICLALLVCRMHCWVRICISGRDLAMAIIAELNDLNQCRSSNSSHSFPQTHLGSSISISTSACYCHDQCNNGLCSLSSDGPICS